MIRLNLATDYALRTLLLLASRPEPRASVREVAQFYGISADHVSKVVQQLVHGGYLRAERGRGGGIRLARPPATITVAEVVELFEGRVALLECVEREGVCVLQPGCRLQHLLDRATQRMMAELRAATLADLVAPEARSLVQIGTALTHHDRGDHEE